MNKKIISTGISAFLICWSLFISEANAIQYKVQWDSTSIFIESDSWPITIHRWDDPLEIEGDTCDPYKTCEHNYTNSWTYIIAIDSESAQNITELRLRNSNITEIIDMEGGINIEELDLSYNHIENLWSNAFNWLNNIENLNLSNNKINNISKYAFSGSVIQNWKLMTYELHSAQVDPNYPYYREYWVTRVGNGIPCVRGQQTSSQICIDEANRTINLSNNELSNIPTFIENRENGSDSIEWTKLILADNATREYEYLVWNQFPTTWINVSRIINLKKNNLLSPVSVGSKDVAYNGPNLRSAPYSWVYVTRNLYNSRSSNITSSYILTDPAWNIFTGNVNGILTWNEATEFGITPFHPKDGDDKYETAHRINWNYTIDIKILSWDEVITTWTGTFDLEFVHVEILWEKLQSINNPKFKVSRSHQLAPIHRTLSSTCQLIIDNEEHYCYPIDYLNTQISSIGREDIDVIIDKNKISNDEWTGYIKIDILNRRDEPVVSDTLYFDYNNYTETNYTVNHYRENVDGNSRSLADTETFTWIVDDEITPSTKTYTGFTSPNTQSGTILSWGLLTINYYYTRNRYTVTYDSNGWTPIADTGILFEATIPTPTPSKNWFTFNTWLWLPSWGKMPATGITLTAEWIENSNPWDPSTPEQTIASYTVKHFKQSITKLYSTTPDEVETFTGIIGDIVSPNVKSYTWFTSPSTTSGTIVSGNSLVIEYRYPRNTYTVTYDSNGWTPIADTGILFEATIPTPTPSKDWYTFEHWNGLPKDWKMPATGVTLTAVWTENSNPWWDPSTPEQTIASYTVKHFKQDIDGSGWSLADSETFTWIVDDIVTPSTKIYTWFSSPNTESKTILSNWELTINYYYTRNTYTVTYDSNGWDSIPSVNVMFEGIIPTPTPNKNWYSFNGWSGLPTSGLMPANDIILTADWNANSWGGNWSSSSSSSSNWGSSSKWHSSEKTENKTGTIISSGIIMQTINPIASGIIQPTSWENYIMKYISRSCKPYNIEYIPELDAYTSPDLKKKEYFVNIEYFKRYVDSKNAQNAECYVTNRFRITTSYIDTSNSNNRFVAPNWKIYFINQQNWFYRSSDINSSKNFTTIDELKNYIKKRNPLIPM